MDSVFSRDRKSTDPLEESTLPLQRRGYCLQLLKDKTSLDSFLIAYYLSFYWARVSLYSERSWALTLSAPQDTIGETNAGLQFTAHKSAARKIWIHASEIQGAKEECLCYKHVKSTFLIIFLQKQKFPSLEPTLGNSITKSLDPTVR